MQQNQSPMPAGEMRSSKNTLVVVGIIVVLVIVGLWIWKQNTEQGKAPQNTAAGDNVPAAASTNDAATTTVQQDSTQAIQQDLQGINSVDLQKEFNQIDTNLNNL